MKLGSTVAPGLDSQVSQRKRNFLKALAAMAGYGTANFGAGVAYGEGSLAEYAYGPSVTDKGLARSVQELLAKANDQATYNVPDTHAGMLASGLLDKVIHGPEQVLNLVAGLVDDAPRGLKSLKKDIAHLPKAAESSLKGILHQLTLDLSKFVDRVKTWTDDNSGIAYA